MRVIVDLLPERPAYGLAIDEILLASVRDEGSSVLRVWVNDRAIVLGRSQVVSEEAVTELARTDGIPILRRLSGGGTVFHHPGNLCITVCDRRAGPKESVEVLFGRWGELLCDALRPFAPCVAVEGNALALCGSKLGGAAQIHRGAARLYHATILVTEGALEMDRYLRAGTSEYCPSYVRSRAAPLTCLERTAGTRVPLRDVGASVVERFSRSFPCESSRLETGERTEAEKLAQTKYGSPAWTERLQPT